MGKHVDSVGLDVVGPDPEAVEKGKSASVGGGIWSRVRGPRGLTALAVLVVMTLGAAAGWLGFRGYEDKQDRAERELFVQAASQGVVNLTSFDHTTVDADVARILESSTGAFRDDFQERARAFADEVRQAKSSSVGTISNAAVETEDGSQAQVLVHVSMKMSSAAGLEEAGSWRMRVSVQKTGDTAKVSDVQFVP